MMQSWNGWPLERLVYGFLAVAYLAVWAQLTMYHYRGGFRSKAMWGPVIFTPLAVVACLLALATRADWVITVLTYVLAVAALEGLAGAFLHLKGVASMVGGLSGRNLLAGPPFILPVIYAALGIFGLLVRYWPQLSGGRP